MTGLQIAQHAKEQLAELTGQKADTVSALRKDEDGWHVTVVMLEMHRIPDAQDILGNYETLLDDKGVLISYARTRRYLRQETLQEEDRRL